MWEVVLRKAVVPIFVFIAVFGIGAYLTVIMVAPDDHKTKALVMGCVGLGAALGYSFAAFSTGLFKRPWL
jgi:hypothetical protein